MKALAKLALNLALFFDKNCRYGRYEFRNFSCHFLTCFIDMKRGLLMTDFWCPTWNYLPFHLLQRAMDSWDLKNFCWLFFFSCYLNSIYTWFSYSKIIKLFNDEEICQVGWIFIAFSLKRCFHSEIFRKCESRHHWEKNWSNL